ncbi:uncharacterized protein LOC130769940 [Actinidia eriantha]|uniref:uncharacterized protein LOC130769940 n=1 Tax=Actinidia eriantha TaxID=165200 RepID=UPI00258AF8A4|nr:uncharacterized protein LOC130769940 [Actinidia eriantha]
MIIFNRRLTVSLQALHDGNEVYFMLQVDGDYAYTKGENDKCPSVALMFQIGENTSYHRETILAPKITGKRSGGTCMSVLSPLLKVLWRKIAQMHQMAKRGCIRSSSQDLREPWISFNRVLRLTIGNQATYRSHSGTQ